MTVTTTAATERTRLDVVSLWVAVGVGGGGGGDRRDAVGGLLLLLVVLMECVFCCCCFCLELFF